MYIYLYLKSISWQQNLIMLAFWNLKAFRNTDISSHHGKEGEEVVGKAAR